MSRKRRPHLAESKPPVSSVKITRKGINSLHPLVREQAMKVAKGDATRIRVVDHFQAIVE